MSGDKDWKAEYIQLLDRHETESAAQAELEQLLTRTIIRLTLAASGLDGKLDPHLKRIRDAARQGASPRLGEQLNRLSDDLMHLEEAAASESADVQAVCSRLLERWQLPPAQAGQAAKQLAEILLDPAQVSEEGLDQLAAQLRPQAPEAAGRRGAGLLGRLLSTHTSPSPNEILLNLLEQANWPGHWAEAVDELKASLSPRAAEDAWVGVLQELLELSARSYGEVQSEIEEAGNFLEELTRRLQELDVHLRQVHAGRDEMVGYGRRLSDQVSFQVDGLESSVRDAKDLNQLRQAVGERLSAITQTLEDFLKEEQQWYRRSESNEQGLRERLEQLERESSDLRLRMLEAHQLAMRDAVTGLPNRTAYDERIAQEFARWKRFAEPLALLIWDVDDFKSINDRFGHPAGDKALRIIAQSLRQRLRETDFIGRYGGEEFVTLLSGADAGEALKVAEEMRQAVEGCGFHSNSRRIPVTISCGIACFAKGDTPEQVLERADQALYRAKHAGKNRCELA